MAAEGWSKNDFRKAFWERTRIPLSAWPGGCPHREGLAAIMGPLTPQSLIPVTFEPEQLAVVIGGGDGKHSHYFPSYPGSFTVSRRIDE